MNSSWLHAEDIRRIEMLTRGADGQPLMAYNVNVGTGEPVTFDIRRDIEFIEYRDVHRRVPKSNYQTFTISGPLKDAEIRLGPAIADAVLCRWDAEAEKYVPVTDE